jgi:hypothetical protein
VIELLLFLLIGLLVVGIVYWIAALVLPHPIPLIVAAVGLLIVLLWLIGAAGDDESTRDGVQLLTHT